MQSGSGMWMDEVDLDPQRSWLSMSTRALGEEPWLLPDGRRGDELTLRARLLDERPDEVLIVPPSADSAVAELAALIVGWFEEHASPPGHEPGASAPLDLVLGEPVLGEPVLGEPVLLDPALLDPALSGRARLERLGRAVQEDLCLLRRGPEEWELEAGVVCFPSRWPLPDRIGKPMSQVHGPTPGYDPVLVDRITSLFDRLGDRIVRRRNWFFHPDPTLFQPRRPAADPVIPAERVADELWMRSERQTLRALPDSGRVVFTIRTQHATLGDFIADPSRRYRFLHYLDQAPTDQLDHRGLSAPQLEELRRAGISEFA